MSGPLTKFAGRGESHLLSLDRDAALISALGRAFLILEVLGAVSVSLHAAQVAPSQDKNYSN